MLSRRIWSSGCIDPQSPRYYQCSQATRSPYLSLQGGGHEDRGLFCFFEWMTGILGASAPLPLIGKGLLQPRFRCITLCSVCTTQALNILNNGGVTDILLALPTGADRLLLRCQSCSSTSSVLGSCTGGLQPPQQFVRSFNEEV